MKRRSDGDGSIYQRADGKWIAQLDISHGLKPRRYLRSSHATRAAAKTGLEDLQRRGGSRDLHPHATVRDWLQDWLVRQQAQLRPTSLASYTSLTERIILPALGHLKLSELSVRHVQLWMDRAIDAGTGARTVAYARTVLRSALRDAMRHGLLSANVADLTKPPKSAVRAAPPVQPAQMARLLKIAKSSWLHPLIVLTLLYALRRGELLGLAEDAIDRKAGVLEIRRTVVRLTAKGDGPRLVVEEPKTARSQRLLPLHPWAITALTTLRARRKALQKRDKSHQWRTKADDGSPMPAWIVPSDIGTPLEPATLHRAWGTLRQRAGFPTLRWHDLRHAAVTIRKGAQVDARDVADTAGHSSVQLTHGAYDHGTLARIGVGVTAMVKALEEAKGGRKWR